MSGQVIRRSRIPVLVLWSLFAGLSAPAIGGSIETVGVDVKTNDAWRTADVAKPFGDADNIYGTDGYLVAQYPDGDPENEDLPGYAEVELAAGLRYEGVGSEPHQAMFDDVVAPGPAPVEDLVAGDYWFSGGEDGNVQEFFFITLTEAASFRLGVITDQTPDNPPGLFWEASRSIQVTGPNGLETELVDVSGPDEKWRDADVDYVLFDISGDEGDEFIVWGENDSRWEANALGGIFFDPLPNPDGPKIPAFGATPTEITAPGQRVLLSWEVELPLDALTLTPGDIDALSHTDGTGEGELAIDPGPNGSTTYKLEAIRGDDSGASSIQVVLAPPDIVSFTALPAELSPGQVVVLSWEVSLPVSSLILQPVGADLLPSTGEDGKGTLTIDPGPLQRTTFELVATRGEASTRTAETTVAVRVPGQGISVVGVDELTDDAWRSTDVEKPFGDDDNIYGTDGYFIAQFPDGDERNLVEPPYATIDLVGGLRYEGTGAEPHQAMFDDVLETGPGDVPDAVAGDYWLNSGATGDEDDFFTITLTENASFRLGVIADQTPDNPPGLFWESSRAVRITSSNDGDTGLVDVTGPDEEWRDADVDYVLFDITGSKGDVYTVWGEQDDRWRANALGGVFFDPRQTGVFQITKIDREADAVSITFTSLKGANYAIDASTDLQNWTELDDGVTGEEGLTTVADQSFGAHAGDDVYYRVREL